MTAAEAVADDLRSRRVKPDAMPWQKLQFEGCEVKPLYVDIKTGQATLLIRMAPGATLPDHEHALLEQTYMLEGRLVGKVQTRACASTPANSSGVRPEAATRRGVRKAG
jgi:quercetin dioxygenase-like cupin family protein